MPTSNVEPLAGSHVNVGDASVFESDTVGSANVTIWLHWFGALLTLTAPGHEIVGR
jgi:hypothetical protein